MPLTAKAPKTDRILIPEDTYLSICYSLVDFGTQYSEKYDKHTRIVCLGWEIPDYRINMEDTSMPAVMSQRFSLSLHPKAKLRQYLEAWRGRQFTPEELSGFNLQDILMKPCMLTILHHTTESGETYQRIAGIANVYKGIETPETTENPVQYFSMEEGMEIPENLYPWQVEEIKKSREYQNGAPF